VATGVETDAEVATGVGVGVETEVEVVTGLEEIPIIPSGKRFRSSEWTIYILYRPYTSITGSISKLDLAYDRQTEEKMRNNPRNAVLLPNRRVSPHRNLM
jgi:hypothetical protein